MVVREHGVHVVCAELGRVRDLKHARATCTQRLVLPVRQTSPNTCLYRSEMLRCVHAPAPACLA